MYKETEKICSFYANELHLTTILMQYIYKKIEEGTKILNVLEKDLEKEVEAVLELFNCKNSLKIDIKNIGWNKISEERIKSLERTKEDEIIIIAGRKSFVDEIKQKLSNNKNIIIDCYELIENAEEAMEVLDKHDYVLMTEGLRKITGFLI